MNLEICVDNHESLSVSSGPVGNPFSPGAENRKWLDFMIRCSLFPVHDHKLVLALPSCVSDSLAVRAEHGPRHDAVWRWLACVALGVLLVFGVQGPAFAQQGVVTGRAVDAESNEPVSGVAVEVVVGSGRALHSATTNAQGEFRIAGVADGRYSIVFTSLGYETKRVDGVRVAAGEGAVSVGTVVLTSVVFRLNPIVVTASRTQEKALDSPSSVYTVEAEAIEERTTTTPVDHIRSLPFHHA